MLLNTFVVKALLKEGFFIEYTSPYSLKLRNNEGIKFHIIDCKEGDENTSAEFTKYIEIGDVSFISINLRGYNQILNEWEKCLKYLQNAPDR